MIPMIPLSIVWTYYNAPSALQRHLSALSSLDESVLSSIEVVIVDDGSWEEPAQAVFDQIGALGFSYQLIKVDQDIPWHHRAARNIGAFEARGERLLLLDIDTEVIPEKLHLLFDSDIWNDDERVSVLYIHGYRSATGSFHHESLLMFKRLYWRIGGYDENFDGYWGVGALWHKRARKVAKDANWDDVVLLRHIGESCPDSQTNLRRRNSMQRRIRIRLLRTERALGLRAHKVLSSGYKLMARKP